MNDEKDSFDTMVAASKKAAGLPSGWGTTTAPLGAQEDLEDAPRPERSLRDDHG